MAMPENLQMERYYEDGFVPVSWEAPHSSLHRSITWVAMGCIITGLAGFGLAIFGAASATIGSQENPGFYIVLGLIVGSILVFGGFYMVHLGRKNYREYKARSGRIH